LKKPKCYFESSLKATSLADFEDKVVIPIGGLAAKKPSL
jgi:hypothetical protein